MAMLELRTLGPSALHDGTTDVDGVLRQPKRLALLAYLACAPRGRTRDTVQALFWPELDRAAARNALSQALHFLRRHLGEGVVVGRGAELWVDPERLAADVRAFDEALAAGDAERAVALYGGEFLSGLHAGEGAPELERWIDGERLRLRTRAREALRRSADALEAAGDLAAALERAGRALELDPFDEAGVRRLMLLHDAAGDRAAALQAYEHFARRLSHELGGEPATATRELATRLRAPAGPGGAPEGAVSLAVLPFADFGAAGTDEYLADGLTEELIAALAVVDGLRVTSRTSSFVYRRRQVPLRTIGAELGVAYVVEGSIRRGDDRIRVVVQLIEVRTDAHVWAERFEWAESDPLQLQVAAADAIAGALRLRLAPDERRRLAGRPSETPAAMQLYLRARHFLHLGSLDGWWQAVELLGRALEADPSFALAHAALADAYLRVTLFHFDPPVTRREAEARAEPAARRAIELRPELGEAHTALGVVLWHRREWEQALAELRRGTELSPASAAARQRYGLCLAFMGRWDEARREMREAQMLDPLSLSIAVDAGVVDLRQRRFERAVRQFQQALAIDPACTQALHYLSEAYGYMGRPLLSIELLERQSLMSAADTARLRRLLSDGGEEAFRHALPAVMERAGAAPGIQASALIRAGHAERAWEMLWRAVEVRDPALTDGIRVHPGFDLFRADPRWPGVLRAMGIDPATVPTLPPADPAPPALAGALQPDPALP